MKKITLETLTGSMQGISYQEQYRKIMERISRGEIRPVRASGTNGKKPALYREYRVCEAARDYSRFEEELKYQMVPAISVDYYLNHPDTYEEDREAVLLLNDYLKNHRELLKYSESVNERSFEIWGKEKFLTKGPGRKILGRCGVSEKALNMYGTAEPFACYTRTRETPQNILVLENKDPFYSMRRFLMEGSDVIFGVPVGTLIYGGGKRVLRSFSDFDLSAEPYMKQEENRIFYFGDMDYEGIGIYENLAEEFPRIEPFVPGYEAMLDRADRLDKCLPETKEQQNKNLTGRFFSCFREETVRQMERILEEGRYIPQEILNIQDFQGGRRNSNAV